MKKVAIIVCIIGITLLILPILIRGYSSLLLVPAGGVLLGLGVILLIASLIVPQERSITPFEAATGSPKKYPILGLTFTASILLFGSYFASIPYSMQDTPNTSVGLLLLWLIPLGTSIVLYILAIVFRIKSRR